MCAIQQVACSCRIQQPARAGRCRHPPTCRSEGEPVMSAPPPQPLPQCKDLSNNHLSCWFLFVSLCWFVFLCVIHLPSLSVTVFITLSVTTSLSPQPSHRPTDHPLIFDAPPQSKNAPGCVLLPPPPHRDKELIGNPSTN